MQSDNIYPPVPEHQPPTPITSNNLADSAPAQFPQPHTAMPTMQNHLVHSTTSSTSSEPMVATLDPPVSVQPIPVVKVLSTRGVEYGMMTIALWIVASTMAWVVLNLLNGSSGFNSVVVPTSALVVCLPVFAFFFLRLKRAELADPSSRMDPSKRRWSQLTQFLAYIACLINVIYFVYVILQHASSSGSYSIGKSIINLVVVLVIAGGVLAYYWADEHRNRRS